MLSDELLEKLLRRAFNLGQKYWQQADSESFSENRRSDETLRKFEVLVTEARAVLAAAAPAAWISVEDRLPPKFTEVLIAFAGCTLPACAQYTDNPTDIDGWCYPAENRGDGYDWTVTHWMPLPLTLNELTAASRRPAGEQSHG